MTTTSARTRRMLGVCLAGMLAAPALGQTIRGTITGTVTDVDGRYRGGDGAIHSGQSPATCAGAP